MDQNCVELLLIPLFALIAAAIGEFARPVIKRPEPKKEDKKK